MSTNMDSNLMNIRQRSPNIEKEIEEVVEARCTFYRGSTSSSEDNVYDEKSKEFSLSTTSEKQPSNNSIEESDSYKIEVESSNKDINKVPIADSEGKFGYGPNSLNNIYDGMLANKRGREYWKNGDKERAFSEFKIAAKKFNYPAGLFNLAVCYHFGVEGDCGVKPNLDKAILFYVKAAVAGNRKALYNLLIIQPLFIPEELQKTAELEFPEVLGIAYTENENYDPDKAVRLFQRNADEEIPSGEYNLGVCYDIGFGLEKCQDTAGQWYEKAARKNQPDALHNLGVYHELGLGGYEVNKSRAKEYYIEASNYGSPTSLQDVERLNQEDSYIIPVGTTDEMVDIQSMKCAKDVAPGSQLTKESIENGCEFA